MFVRGKRGGRDREEGSRGGPGSGPSGCNPVILLSLAEGTRHTCPHTGRLVCPPRSPLWTLFHHGHSFHLLLFHVGRFSTLLPEKTFLALVSRDTNIYASSCHREPHMPTPRPPRTHLWLCSHLATHPTPATCRPCVLHSC